MSAFLGPIHYWLYNKIQQQQEIVDEFYDIGKKNGLSLEEECNNLYGTFENKPLDEMIDHGNIHGWLQERVSQVEYKYAYCVIKLLEKNPDNLDSLKSASNEKGANLGIYFREHYPNAEDVYKIISDNLLDGMPCDHANRVLSQNGQEVQWKREVCVHSPYWDELGGDIKVYYILRDAWIEGFVRELGYVYEKVDEATYLIRERGSDEI